MPRSARHAPLLALVLASLAGSAVAASLTAGDVDDHLNWAQYLRYVDRVAGQQGGLPSLALADRVTVQLRDAAGAPWALAPLAVHAEGDDARVVRLVAGTDGIVRLFPRFDGFGSAQRLVLEAGGTSKVIDLAALDASRTVTLDAKDAHAKLPSQADIMLVIDTTGSMSDELSYLASELQSIVGDVVAAEPGASIRVGVTVYRDVGDDYVVKSLGFAPDVATAQSWLAQQSAGGGGDYPEAMDQALAAAVGEQWRGEGTAKLLLLVADAPPHPEKDDAFLAAVGRARAAGIHVHPLAASGAGADAQYMMRAAAALTQGRYLFLTDDSGIGNAHEEPAVSCYLVTTLHSLVARVVRSELTGERVEPAAADVVRSVGHYDRGVCLDAQDAPAPPTTSATPSGSTSPAPVAGTASSLATYDASASDGSPRAESAGGSGSPSSGTPMAKVPGPSLVVVALVAGVVALGWGRRR